MLLGLWHRAIGRCDHEDRSVHLCRTGDHVLDVVGVAWAVDVCVVALLGLVLDMCDRDGDTALTLFWRLVDLVEWGEWVHIWVSVVEHFGDRRSKSGLTVVDVTDGADVHVRFCPLELRLCH